MNSKSHESFALTPTPTPNTKERTFVGEPSLLDVHKEGESDDTKQMLLKKLENSLVDKINLGKIILCIKSLKLLKSLRDFFQFVSFK